jgi:MFS family permease
LGHLPACSGHVRAIVFHRQSNHPVWRYDRDGLRLRIALTVNGVGWNFLFVGATTLVTTCYRPNERGKTQALNDLLVFSTTATASFMAGFLQDRWGWQPLNWLSVFLMLLASAAVIWLHYQRPALSPAR